MSIYWMDTVEKYKFMHITQPHEFILWLSTLTTAFYGNCQTSYLFLLKYNI